MSFNISNPVPESGRFIFAPKRIPSVSKEPELTILGCLVAVACTASLPLPDWSYQVSTNPFTVGGSAAVGIAVIPK